ncbi:MAG: response regulator transcription factor [Hyphomicrobiales bacterium]|nr:response regulator transcription factor [Hyphomicrobiales bacterium]
MKILIVDDHPVLRAGLAALLGQARAGSTIIEAGNAAEAFKQVDLYPDLDIVILDLVLPDMGGLSVLAEFGRRCPGLPVIVLSSSEDPQGARRALSQGALGYVPKSASQNTLSAAIELVMSGEIYVPPMLLNEVAGVHRNASSESMPPLLTERQIQVLRHLDLGQPNKTIAFKLGLSEKTVKAHITAILKALHARNRTHAVSLGRLAGLI